jgi:hypothetical protein
MKGYSYGLKNDDTNTSPTPDLLICDPVGASYDLYRWIIVHPWTKTFVLEFNGPSLWQAAT